ncbi:MAG: RNA methyltransferase [Treponema sp.]|nr:RNA methyltransferase [Treponema sp.]
MNLDNIVIILSRPEESRNIGSVCRAMANCGIKTLRIVADKSSIDEEKVRVLAIHASPIFENAEFYSSITDAAKDCSIIAATTRRKGKKRKGKLLLPEEFCSIAENSDGKIAVVFGNERTGLEDDELEECTLAVTIPSSDEFGSLNLSHAVQIMCYHFFRKANPALRGYSPVDMQRLEKTTDTIIHSLEEIGFFKVAGKKDMQLFWKNILSRAALSEGEAQYLEKTFNKAAGLCKKNQ